MKRNNLTNQIKLRLETDRIRLRKIKRSDAESIYKYAKAKEISRYTFIPRPYTIKNATTFIRQSQILFRKKKEFHLGIELKETGEIIGMIGLIRIDYKNKNAELGCWLGKKFWRKGIMGEAVSLMLRFGFKELKLVRIYARVMTPNIASAKLVESAGFTLEGHRRRVHLHRRRWVDDYLYAMVK